MTSHCYTFTNYDIIEVIILFIVTSTEVVVCLKEYVTSHHDHTTKVLIKPY